MPAREDPAVEPVKDGALGAQKRQQMHALGTIVEPAVPFHSHALVQVEATFAELLHQRVVAVSSIDQMHISDKLADAIFFLCSERSSYITGQILAVDGGFDAAGIGLPTLRGQRRNG